MIAAVALDADGVLLDSLEPHLEACRAAARRLGLRTVVMSAGDVRSRVMDGSMPQPIADFFAMVGGLPRGEAARMAARYYLRFARDHQVEIFRDADVVLRSLEAARLPLALVTANSLSNVSRSLGDGLMSCFDYVHARDTGTEPSSDKVAALAEFAQQAGCYPSEVLFVGDTPADERAARKAGTMFMASAYGWGFSPGDRRPEAVEPLDILAHVEQQGGGV